MSETKLHLQKKRLCYPILVRHICAICLLLMTISCVQKTSVQQTKQDKNVKLPVAGEVFDLNGYTAFLILPERTQGQPTPWVWYSPTLLDHSLPGEEETVMFKKFLEAGIAIAGIDIGESYGSPQGRILYSSLYKELVKKRGLSQKPCLLARSRGGLMHYSWAAENASSVSCIAGIYPVCDIRSYPGLKEASTFYGLTEQELADQLGKHNPINKLERLAEANVPIFHVHGDNDTVVPIELNSEKLAYRYQALGGDIQLLIKRGQGHNYWPGWFQCQELMDFVITHAQ